MTTTETENDPAPVLHLPARDIPLPRHVSPAAQAILSVPAPPAAQEFPALEDAPAWRSLIEMGNDTIAQVIEPLVAGLPIDVEQREFGGVTGYFAAPRTPPANKRSIVLDFHSGGLIMCGGPLCGTMAKLMAGRLDAPLWSPDYRMPPDHPYPAALDDCVAAYRAVLDRHRPEDIVIAGGSAGGNLAAATILRARDEGLPMPAGAILITPEVDLTETGDSFSTNQGLDKALDRLMQVNLLYANGHDLAHPYLSPLFGDFAAGFPPTILVTGTRDMFLSNTVRLHRALREAGIRADLHVLEAADHAGFLGTPEQTAIDGEMRQFLAGIWERSGDAAPPSI